jgi:hypothetical protein
LFLHGLLPRKEREARGPSAKVSQTTRGSASVADAQKVKALEDENRRLKMLLAESMLNLAALKDQKGALSGS